jgi:hypothetical protein
MYWQPKLYKKKYLKLFRGHRGRDRDHMVVGLTTYAITTNVVSLNPTQAIQRYVIKFVSDLRQVGGYSGILQQ